jgi:hypothetical protein
MYLNWINGILGLVIFGVAFMDLSGTMLTWTLAIVGLLVAAISFWEVLNGQTSSDYEQEVHRHGHA